MMSLSSRIYENKLARVALASGSQCRCGKEKKPIHVVCNSCWFSAPHEVRHELKFGSVAARRAAMRLLLDAASGRGVLRELRKARS